MGDFLAGRGNRGGQGWEQDRRPAVLGKGLVLLGEHCQAERDGRGMRRERRTLVCWAQDLKVPSLGAKVGNQEGFPTGYGSVIAGKQFSRSFGPETPCDFWDRCPPPPRPTPKLRRSFHPPTVSGAFTQAHPFSFPFVGSQLPCCGRWKSSPSQACTASLEPFIPGRDSFSTVLA